MPARTLQGERVGGEGRIGQEVAAGGVEADVGDEAEVVVALAGDADELADADVLDGLVAVEAGAQAVDERALDDQPESVVSHSALTLPWESLDPHGPSLSQRERGASNQSTSARRIAVRRG